MIKWNKRRIEKKFWKGFWKEQSQNGWNYYNFKIKIALDAEEGTRIGPQEFEMFATFNEIQEIFADCNIESLKAVGVAKNLIGNLQCKHIELFLVKKWLNKKLKKEGKRKNKRY